MMAAGRSIPAGDMDVSSSVKAYYALKLIGDDADALHMHRARKAILDRGGAARSNVFTRTSLALFGQVPWRAVPVMPVELVLLPSWFPFHLDKVSYWSRVLIAPLTILMSLKPRARNPRQVGIEELFVTPASAERHYITNPTGSALGHGLIALDHVLRLVEPWVPAGLRRRAIERSVAFITEHLNGEDGLGAIFPPMAASVMQGWFENESFNSLWDEPTFFDLARTAMGTELASILRDRADTPLPQVQTAAATTPDLPVAAAPLQPVASAAALPVASEPPPPATTPAVEPPEPETLVHDFGSDVWGYLEARIMWSRARLSVDFKSAEAYAASFERNDLVGWRLPTTGELKEICTASAGHGEANPPQYLWTSDRGRRIQSPLAARFAIYDCQVNAVDGLYSGRELRRMEREVFALPVRPAGVG